MRKIILVLYVAFLIPLFAAPDINFWQKLFTEPVERMYIVMKNRIIFRLTSNDEKSINMNFGIMEKELKKRKYKIDDIEIVIHSHFANCKFSDSDYRQYRALKKGGFNGRFLLYCHRTNKTYDIEKRKATST